MECEITSFLKLSHSLILKISRELSHEINKIFVHSLISHGTKMVSLILRSARRSMDSDEERKNFCYVWSWKRRKKWQRALSAHVLHAGPHYEWTWLISILRYFNYFDYTTVGEHAYGRNDITKLFQNILHSPMMQYACNILIKMLDKQMLI